VSELQRLRDRVEQLEELLGVGQDDLVLIRMATGLRPSQAKILGILHKRRRVYARWEIYDILYGYTPEADQPVLKIIEVMVAQMRPKLKHLGIEIATVYGFGYTMDDTNRAELTALIERQRERARRMDVGNNITIRGRLVEDFGDDVMVRVDAPRGFTVVNVAKRDIEPATPLAPCDCRPASLS
jgi:hypothetical protein